MTRAATQAEQWDHDRDYIKHDSPGRKNPVFNQRICVASLIGHCEAIAASGHLTEPCEASLRLLIAKTLVAFDMPSKAELAAQALLVPGAKIREEA